MFHRIYAGVPPVTEAEFAELAAWFAANEGRLRGTDPDGALDLGAGRRVWCSNVRHYLAKGPRADGAGRVAEDVRELKRGSGG